VAYAQKPRLDAATPGYDLSCVRRRGDHLRDELELRLHEFTLSASVRNPS
jgi:hypothetical protein